MAGQERPELVIVRRRGPFEDSDYKNGVWKIAYADFMTAMMAFFLVMWLINAVNQETRESVASYFNPVKLAESTPDRKGLNDPKRVDPGKAEEQDSTKPLPEMDKLPRAEQRTSGRQPRFDEAALFRDPYSVLSEIAGGPPNATRRELRIGAMLDPAQQHGMKGGEAYRDPFDPIYWQVSPRSPVESKASMAPDRGSLPFDEDLALLSEADGGRPQGRPDATVASKSVDAAPIPSDPTADPPASHPPAATSPAAAPAPSPAEGAAPAAAPPVMATPAAAAPVAAGQAPEAAASLQAAIAAALGSQDAGQRPLAEVRKTDEGLLISLTDDLNFGMFAIGSAEPQPELVRAVDRIAPLLAKHAGPMVIRGHTDNRPFRSQGYDNWRLSTARAHMAYHMLVRAGIDPLRIERIEGHADRAPKLAKDPAASPNRRIEILIREPRA